MNNSNKGFPLVKRQVCTACLLLFAALTGGMDVQAVDVSDFTDLQSALSSNAPVIDLKANIDAAANLNSTTATPLTINGSGFYLDGEKTYSGINSAAEALYINDNIAFKNFKSSNSGGAIRNQIFSDIKLTIGDNARFSDNSAGSYGGAIFNYGEYLNLTIGDNTVFSNNSATSNSGGAICNNSAYEAQLTIGDNAVFSDNSAGSYGGAIYNNGAINVQLTIGDNAVFFDNSANNDGGAIYSNASGGAQIKIGNNALFSDNSATSGSGGAIYNYSNYGVQLTIGANAVFSDNSANNDGGAIYNGAAFDTVITIGDNAVFSNNTAGGNGGAIYNYVNYSPPSINSTINITGAATFTGNKANNNPNDIYMGGSGTSHTLNISGDSGTVYFDGGIASSNANATINKSGKGTLTFAKRAMNTGYTGTFNQTAGTTTVYGQFFNNALANNISNSNLNFYQDADYGKINVLNLDTVNVSSMNNIINAVNVGTLGIAGVNNFNIDVNGQNYDTFTADSITYSGIINISALNFMSVPTAQSMDLDIFQSPSIDAGITFDTGLSEITTPIYKYNFAPKGNSGSYRLWRNGNDFNPQVFRGQAAKLAVYQNQLIVNNTLFDHVYLDSNERTAMANKYAVD
ncbi:MAG: hypothetical protein LBK53_07430, partial [Heliobacteriaceae bacterium]|nr:hypothetical protein [Heliobacteriaceae bacterium]